MVQGSISDFENVFVQPATQLSNIASHVSAQAATPVTYPLSQPICQIPIQMTHPNVQVQPVSLLYSTLDLCDLLIVEITPKPEIVLTVHFIFLMKQ